METDLFGEQPKQSLSIKGYRGDPGAGPEGETCKSCKHHTMHQMSKRYHKCGLTAWTHGQATDIKVSSPACQFWEKK